MIDAIALLVVFALGIVAAYFKGEQVERGKQAKKENDAARKASDVDKQVDAMSDSDKREWLRNNKR